jgi:hypothetical protein
VYCFSFIAFRDNLKTCVWQPNDIIKFPSNFFMLLFVLVSFDLFICWVKVSTLWVIVAKCELQRVLLDQTL